MVSRTQEEINRKRFVYIIRITNTNYYKIGISSNIEERLSDLQTATPFEMQLILKKGFEDFFLIESYIQNAFINKHVRGEWFELATYDINSIKNFLEKIENNDAIKNDISKRLVATKRYRKRINASSVLKSAIYFKNISLGPSNLDISKEWYITYYAKEKRNDNYKRFKIKGGLNKIKEKGSRLIAAENLKIHIIRALESGYNPFKEKINLSEYIP